MRKEKPRLGKTGSPVTKDPTSCSYSKKAGGHIGRDRINNCRHIAEKGYFSPTN